VILITGGNGFLGKALIEQMNGKGQIIASLSRNPPVSLQNGVLYWKGDILQPNLGLQPLKSDIEAVYHMAGTVNLSLQDKKGEIYNINVMGTRNVIQFCEEHGVQHLYYISTAYTQFRNPYERSKATAEEFVKMAKIPQVTIFKPSIILGTGNHFSLEHFPQYAMLMVKLHKRADLVRRKIEGSLHLPVIEPLFRLNGNPQGKLNLIPVDEVAGAIAQIKTEGVYWLTNPYPPTTQEIADWLGEAILLNIKVLPHFNAMPIETAFMRLTRAFQPYLEGDDFPSEFSANKKMVTRETITEMVTRMIGHADS
jgi:nucleoside-diphosphate-sugar epimerase